MVSIPGDDTEQQRQAVADVVRTHVVTPVLDELLRPTEIESVRVRWREVRWPKRPISPSGPGPYSSVLMVGDIEWESEEKLVLDLVAVGESFEHHFFVTGLNVAHVDVRWLERQLYSDLQDFIAESSFGWGQLRGKR